MDDPTNVDLEYLNAPGYISEFLQVGIILPSLNHRIHKTESYQKILIKLRTESLIAILARVSTNAEFTIHQWLSSTRDHPQAKAQSKFESPLHHPEMTLLESTNHSTPGEKAIYPSERVITPPPRNDFIKTLLSLVRLGYEACDKIARREIGVTGVGQVKRSLCVRRSFFLAHWYAFSPPGGGGGVGRGAWNQPLTRIAFTVRRKSARQARNKM